MYRVELRRAVQKFLDRIQKQERTKIITALLELEQNPRPKGVEKVRNTELWRVREGDYRMIYHINDDEKIIIVVRIGHRRDVYRGL
ncbi:MAG: addiction module antitoxin [Chloroflexi bacterium RBG_13_52_12]|nr:MAG: addiction module antitoxin [Chloroflexi bacterium RBG_13_52_12]